jgi:predicted DsbA family dithiol-disulfide isomerase
MELEIWSDIACPWCYVGKRRMEAALASFEHADAVNVTWRSFELDPTAPPAREQSHVELIAQKYGRTIEQVEAMDAQLTGVAAEAGIDMKLSQIRSGNTFDGHRVIHLAAEHGLQDAMKERLMRAYFVEGHDVGDPAVLSSLAEEVGVTDAAQFLASDAGAEEVRAGMATAAELEITAVPTYVFDGGKWSVPGAQDPSVFLLIMRKLYERAAS